MATETQVMKKFQKFSKALDEYLHSTLTLAHLMHPKKAHTIHKHIKAVAQQHDKIVEKIK
ncbi:hypothetical protein GOV09_05845 [Candidatus Woesearchaeota archaeon]|nr:hypothetical protein [Candidatus Woesearchaeota archaeon]